VADEADGEARAVSGGVDGGIGKESGT